MNTHTVEMDSETLIKRAQSRWARGRAIPLRGGYVSELGDNLLLGDLNPETRAEFEEADGGELSDVDGQPAKMRAFQSSSALAVNCFDAWRHSPRKRLAAALRINDPIESFRFEYRCGGYPIGPHAPNLDLLITTVSQRRIAIESKFSEPYRSGKLAVLAEKYFPAGPGVWRAAGLPRAQALADHLRGTWRYLDVPQLLKHLLGLRSDKSLGQVELLYLWYDTGLRDAVAHRAEIARFTDAIVEDDFGFRAMTYQELFASLDSADTQLPPGWATYMSERYFSTSPHAAEVIHRSLGG
jgi:hypothetical protein